MRAINHAMTGAIIGLAITNPVALPLAFASHYLLDGIPHHGNHKTPARAWVFKLTLLLDALLCIGLVVVIGLKHPAYWWLAAVSAFLAASPDFMWMRDFMNDVQRKPKHELAHRHAIVRLHNRIQWFEKPIGIVVELAWAVMAIIFLVFLIQR